MLSIIVAKASSNVIGSKNDLPWYLPADLQHFKDITSGHTVVMGRKTFESILKRLGKPLPGRRNVVLTRDPLFRHDGVEVIHDVQSIKQLGDEVFIIGGADIYRQTIAMADRLYVTDVKADIMGDVTFPEIDQRVWVEVSRLPRQSDDKNQYDFDFVIYDKVT